MLRSVFVTLWVIAGLPGCGADSNVETSPAARPARLITVGTGDHSAPSQFVGKVAPAHTVELGFEIDVTLQQCIMKPGAQIIRVILCKVITAHLVGCLSLPLLRLIMNIYESIL